MRVGSKYSDFITTRNGGPQGSVITLFCFLIYINDICDCIQESEFSLFIDDIALMISDTNSEKLLARLNADLNRIFCWSVFNRVIFDTLKFHLMDLGVRRLSKNIKTAVTFGDSCPQWSRSAKYLGVIIDDKFTLLDTINSLIERIEGSMWRSYAHGNTTREEGRLLLSY